MDPATLAFSGFVPLGTYSEHVAWHAAVVFGCLLNLGGLRRLLVEHAEADAGGPGAPA